MESNRQSRDFAEVEKTAAEFAVILSAHHAGEEFNFGGVQIRVLNPQPGWEHRDREEDDESLVLHLHIRPNLRTAGGRLASPH